MTKLSIILKILTLLIPSPSFLPSTAAVSFSPSPHCRHHLLLPLLSLVGPPPSPLPWRRSPISTSPPSPFPWRQSPVCRRRRAAGNNHLCPTILCLSFVVIIVATVYFMSRPQLIYLIDYACFKPPFICRVPISTFMEHSCLINNFDAKSVDFQCVSVNTSALGRKPAFRSPTTTSLPLPPWRPHEARQSSSSSRPSTCLWREPRSDPARTST